MFQGNGVFLKDGQGVMPAGPAAARLQAGNFGPTPNGTAPPGFVMPGMADALQSVSGPTSNILPQDGSMAPAPNEAPPDLLTAAQRQQIAQALGVGDYGGVPVGPTADGLMYRSEAMQRLGMTPQEFNMHFGG